MLQPLRKKIWQFLTKLTTYPMTIPLLYSYSKGMKTMVYKKTSEWMFATVLFIIPKTGNNTNAYE